MLGGILVTGVLIGEGVLIAQQVSRYQLDHHGVLAGAKVIKAQTVESDGGEGGTSYQYYVDAELPQAGPVVRVGVAGPTFPVGSTILIRYDRNDPTHAIAVQNAPFPMALVCVTVLVLAVPFLIWSGIRSDRRLQKRWQEAAAALGWSYEAVGQPLEVQLASFDTKSRPVRKRIVTGSRGGARFSSFVCSVGSGDNAVSYRVVAVEVPADFPHLWIRRRSRRDPGKKNPRHDLPVVNIGAPEFAKAFVVRCSDSGFAASTVSGLVQSWLLADPATRQYELIGSRTFVVDREKYALETLEQAVDRAIEFAYLLPAASSRPGTWAAPSDGRDGEAVSATNARADPVRIAAVDVDKARAQLWPASNESKDLWSRLERVMRDGGTVTGPVIEAHRAGLLIDVGGLRGFLPKSKIENGRASSLQSYVGRALECRVVKVDRRRNNVELSRRELLS